MKIICYACGRGENPENTIEAIRHCQKVNADWRIEMDLQMTKDDHIVLFHDYETSRTTGVSKQIQEMNLGAVQKLNSGYNFKVGSDFPYRNNPIQIPTFKEVCRTFPKTKFLLDIHTNNVSAIDKIIEIIEENKMEKQIVIVSHYDHVSLEFKKKRPNWIYGAATKEVKKMVYSSFLFLDSFFAIKSNILMLPVKFGNITLLTKRVIKHVKSRDKKLWVWLKEGKEVETVNSSRDVEKLKKLEIDGVFTEFPEKLNRESGLVN